MVSKRWAVENNSDSAHEVCYTDHLAHTIRIELLVKTVKVSHSAVNLI